MSSTTIASQTLNNKQTHKQQIKIASSRQCGSMVRSGSSAVCASCGVDGWCVMMFRLVRH
jgi:hypothetical protein